MESLIHPGVTEEEAVLALVVSVLPLALPLFGLEPLHGSAVVSNERALLLLGYSESGKSSIAAAFVNAGWAFLTDDACAFDGTGRVLPGPPLLGPRALNASGTVKIDYFDKTLVATSRHHSRPAKPGQIVALEPAAGATLEVAPLGREDALTTLLRYTRAPDVLADERAGRRLNVLSRVAGVPLARAAYDPGVHSVEELALAVESWVAGTDGLERPDFDALEPGQWNEPSEAPPN